VSIATTFQPDPARAARLDARMNRELGASLGHIAERCRGKLAFDTDALDALVARLSRGERVRPSVYGRYYDLVRTIERRDRAASERLLAELAAAAPAPPGTEVVALGEAHLGGDTALYLAKWGQNDGGDIGMREVRPDVADAFRGRLAEGLALLEAAVPDLHGEIAAIVHQIVIAGIDPDKRYQFDGGSHYQLWGALFVNGHYHPDRVAVAEVLTHESAHSLLFGFCTERPLVDNDDEARFKSPLRYDPRPMDGIYHATFVSARMHWAMTALARSGLLTAEETERALAAAASDGENFHAGYGVFAEHALPTPVGASLMAGAKAYMDGAGSGHGVRAAAG